MRKFAIVALLFACLTPMFGSTKEAGSKTSPRELHALAKLTIQLRADYYRFTVDDVLLDQVNGKDVLIVYTYQNAHQKKLATIPKQVDRVPVVLQRVPVIVYYVDSKGRMVFP